MREGTGIKEGEREGKRMGARFAARGWKGREERGGKGRE